VGRSLKHSPSGIDLARGQKTERSWFARESLRLQRGRVAQGEVLAHDIPTSVLVCLITVEVDKKVRHGITMPAGGTGTCSLYLSEGPYSSMDAMDATNC